MYLAQPIHKLAFVKSLHGNVEFLPKKYSKSFRQEMPEYIGQLTFL